MSREGWRRGETFSFRAESLMPRHERERPIRRFRIHAGTSGRENRLTRPSPTYQKHTGGRGEICPRKMSRSVNNSLVRIAESVEGESVEIQTSIPNSSPQAPPSLSLFVLRFHLSSFEYLSIFINHLEEQGLKVKYFNHLEQVFFCKSKLCKTLIKLCFRIFYLF